MPGEEPFFVGRRLVSDAPCDDFLGFVDQS
jgi:hypothetical protein